MLTWLFFTSTVFFTHVLILLNAPHGAPPKPLLPRHPPTPSAHAFRRVCADRLARLQLLTLHLLRHLEALLSRLSGELCPGCPLPAVDVAEQVVGAELTQEVLKAARTLWRSPVWGK